MHRISEDGMTMIVVTHEMRFAQRCAHRVIFIEKGTIITDIKIKEFFAKPPSHRILRTLLISGTKLRRLFPGGDGRWPRLLAAARAKAGGAARAFEQ